MEEHVLYHLKKETNYNDLFSRPIALLVFICFISIKAGFSSWYVWIFNVSLKNSQI